MKKMKLRTKLFVLLFLITLLLVGCSAQKTPTTKTNTKIQTEEITPESVLVKEISNGKLVEVYDEYVRVEPEGVKENWMIISNVHDEKELFRIYPCSGCQFEDEAVEISAGSYEIIRFDVEAEEGQKEIRVKDSKNNAYGYAKISVIVE